MKFLTFILALLIFPFNYLNAQCSEDQEVKILLVGDSWAFFMGVDGTIDNVMKDWGHSGNKFYTDLDLAQNGAKTHHFLAPAKKQIVHDAILSRPKLEYVHLSLAGNDMLGNWKSQTFTQAQTDSLIQDVMEKLDSVVQFIKGVRPDVDIVLSGYAYPNFEEVISGFVDPLGGLLYGPEDHPFYSNWAAMEFPNNQDLNEKLNEFTDLVYEFYADDPRIHFVPATGIAQYEYGQNDPLEVPPYGTYPPKSVPLPYGNPEYPSPKGSMRNYELTKDCFHLSQRGYRALIGYTTQKFYHKAMMDDKYFIAENNQSNGSVASDGTTSDKLFVGKYDGIEHKTILSFETQNELEFKPEKASLFLHRTKQTGDNNPINQNIVIEVMDGSFGETITVEVSDYDEVGASVGLPCVFGSNSDGNWVRLDLPEELLEFITHLDVTQFKISAPMAGGSMVEFTGVEDPDFAPVLNIKYGNEPLLHLNEQVKVKPSIIIYPNPANEILNIEVDYATFSQAIMYSIDGKKVLTTINSTVDVSTLKTGTYFVKVVTDKGIVTRKFVKN